MPRIPLKERDERDRSFDDIYTLFAETIYFNTIHIPQQLIQLTPTTSKIRNSFYKSI